ncbi:MAG: hypothetical protein ACTSW7_00945 [Candidatus Thorarchaeota archaeon]
METCDPKHHRRMKRGIQQGQKMDVKESIAILLTAKGMLEDELLEQITRIINTFRETHSIAPSDIYVEMIHRETLGQPKEHVVGRIQVCFDLE